MTSGPVLRAAGAPLGVPLGAALLAGILVAWSPRYWRVAVADRGHFAGRPDLGSYRRHVELPRQTVLVVR